LKMWKGDLVKFRYSEKTTLIEKISYLYLKWLGNIKPKWELFSNFCGLLRLFELYGNRPIWLKLTFKGANLIEIQFLINWRPLTDAPLCIKILFLVEKLLQALLCLRGF
jgi:hypothetical protein